MDNILYLRILQLFENESINIENIKNIKNNSMPVLKLKLKLIITKAAKSHIQIFKGGETIDNLDPLIKSINNYFGAKPISSFSFLNNKILEKLEQLEFLDRYVVNEIIKKRQKQQKGSGICPGFAKELWNFSEDNPKTYTDIGKQNLKEELKKNNIQEQYCMKRGEPQIKIPEKEDNIYIMVFGLGTEKAKEVMTYTFADEHPRKDIVYFFDYNTNGIIKDAWDAYKDIKTIKKLENPSSAKPISELTFNGSRLRMYKLANLIQKCLNNATDAQRVTIICVSHGTIITHGAILRAKIMGECDLSKLNVICLSSPKMPPKNLVPNDKCVNVYFKTDTYLKVFQNFKFFNVPRINDLNTNKEALYHYDNTHQCYIINDTNTFYSLNMDNYRTNYLEKKKPKADKLAEISDFLKYIIKKTDSVNYNHTNFEMMFPFINFYNIKLLNYYIYLILTGDKDDTSVSYEINST
jgi:hypothetical protein